MMENIRKFLFVCGRELRKNISDSGVMVFFLVVPLLYPLLYAFLYSGEVVREVPVVAVDQSHSSISREFLRKADATPDLNIIQYCSDMEEARELMRRHKAYGIILIPDDFSNRLVNGQQATVGAYCDMSGLLYYKALLSGTTMVSLDMNRDIQIEKLALLSANQSSGKDSQPQYSGLTAQQQQVQTMPVRNEYITMFNPSNGFQGFLIPAILILIIQQTMVLGVGMMAGTEYEQRKTGRLLLGGEYNNPLVVLFGKAFAYVLVYSFVSVYLLMLVPHLFHMPQLANMHTLIVFMVPFLLACVFFSIVLAFFVRDRESGFLLFVFASVPMIFMSGISWPGSNIPGVWHYFAQIFPSTHGINGFCRIINDGAMLGDVMIEYMKLWLLSGLYFMLALLEFIRFYRSKHVPGFEFIMERRRQRAERMVERLDRVEEKIITVHEELQEKRAAIREDIQEKREAIREDLQEKREVIKEKHEAIREDLKQAKEKVQSRRKNKKDQSNG